MGEEARDSQREQIPPDAELTGSERLELIRLRAELKDDKATIAELQMIRRAAAGPPREVEGDAGGLGEAAEGDRLTAAEHLPKALLGPERRCRALVGGGLTQGCRGYLASRWLPASSAAMTSVRADTPAPRTARVPPPSAGATVSRVAMTRPRASCSWRPASHHMFSSPSC